MFYGTIGIGLVRTDEVQLASGARNSFATVSAALRDSDWMWVPRTTRWTFCSTHFFFFSSSVSHVVLLTGLICLLSSKEAGYNWLGEAERESENEANAADKTEPPRCSHRLVGCVGGGSFRAHAGGRSAQLRSLASAARRRKSDTTRSGYLVLLPPPLLQPQRALVSFA